MNYITYDIETVANDRAHLYYQTKSYTAPSNYKDKAKIEDYILEARQKDIDKAALTWWTGRIVCIGVEVVNSGEKNCFIGENEREILIQFNKWVKDQETKVVDKDYRDIEITHHLRNTLIGKNSDDFDYGFFVGRSLYQNIGLTPYFRRKQYITDINTIFSYSRSSAQIGRLSDYAWGLNIDGKNGDGSQVAELYKAGDWESIKKYCLQDTAIVTEVMKRYLKEFTPV